MCYQVLLLQSIILLLLYQVHFLVSSSTTLYTQQYSLKYGTGDDGCRIVVPRGAAAAV